MFRLWFDCNTRAITNWNKSILLHYIESFAWHLPADRVKYLLSTQLQLSIYARKKAIQSYCRLAVDGFCLLLLLICVAPNAPAVFTHFHWSDYSLLTEIFKQVFTRESHSTWYKKTINSCYFVRFAIKSNWTNERMPEKTPRERCCSLGQNTAPKDLRWITFFLLNANSNHFPKLTLTRSEFENWITLALGFDWITNC